MTNRRPAVLEPDIPTLTRRYFFLGALALSSACRQTLSHDGTRAGRRGPSAVSVMRAPDYGPALSQTVRDIFTLHGLDVRGKRVVVKPNLVEFSAHTPINTHPAVVKAVVEELEARGAARVLVAEGPGHRRATLDMAAAAGYFDFFPNLESRFVDLNLDDVTRVAIASPRSHLREVYLPNTVLGCDLLVSLAKMKTHHWVGATLAMKNLFGLVPGAIYGWPKNVLHWAGIPECITDLHSLFPRQFAMVDGIEGMEGNGPILGHKKPAGLIVAGRDPISVDATCCRLMGIEPERVKYLHLAGGSRTAEASVLQVGEPWRPLRQRFALPPGMDHLRAD
jgi:uncharacterized protein (DUF362 family)